MTMMRLRRGVDVVLPGIEQELSLKSPMPDWLGSDSVLPVLLVSATTTDVK